MKVNYSLFGKKIDFNIVLTRVYSAKFASRYGSGTGREWVEKSIKKTKGIIIGMRNLQNGAVHWSEDDHEPTYFVPKEYVPCLLVAAGMRKNPVYVPLSELPDKLHVQNDEVTK